MNCKKRFWVLMILLAGMLLLSCCVGRYELSIRDVLNILTGKGGSSMDRNLLLKIRLPRTFFVALSGGALALSGLVFQTIFQNPLVSPDVMGVSRGCSVGAILGILFVKGNLIPSQLLTFGMGLLALFIAMGLAAGIKGNKRYSMIIAGIIVGAIANSMITLFKYVADPNRELPSIEYWLMGSFQNSGWDSLGQTMLPILISCVILYLLRWKIKVLTLGDEEAKSLGVSIHFVRNLSLICATILTAAVVSKAGVVEWIGLLAPHLIRKYQGEGFDKNFFSCMALGAIFLLAADLCSRNLSAAEIPVSIFTSFLGALILAFFFIKERKNHGN